MEGAPARRERLPLTWVLGAIDECAQLGVASLYLSGGEPLLYPGLDKLLHMARARELDTTLCTNATLVTARRALRFHELGAKVNVSIDGDAEFHDRFRNLPGAFAAAERGLQRLVAARVPVTVIMTISQANARLLPAVAQWALEAGVTQLRVQPLLGLGRGLAISNSRLDTQSLDRLLLQLTDLANIYGPRGMKCNLVGASRSFLLKHPCGAYVRNGAGCHRRVAQEIRKLVIREDGTIFPEVTNLSRDFAIGTIHDGPLQPLIERYFQDGYVGFDQLCRTTYSEVIPTWNSEFVPWDELVAARSHAWRRLPLARTSSAAPALFSRCGSTCEAQPSA